MFLLVQAHPGSPRQRAMEEADKDWMMIRMVCECFLWYRLTPVVRDKGP